MQKRKHHGQHAANDGKVCQQPGGVGRRKDTAVHGRKEESRHVALQHDACVGGLLVFTFYSNADKKKMRRPKETVCHAVSCWNLTLL